MSRCWPHNNNSNSSNNDDNENNHDHDDNILYPFIMHNINWINPVNNKYVWCILSECNKSYMHSLVVTSLNA